jgi:hypothetical protein
MSLGVLRAVSHSNYGPRSMGGHNEYRVADIIDLGVFNKNLNAWIEVTLNDRCYRFLIE